MTKGAAGQKPVQLGNRFATMLKTCPGDVSATTATTTPSTTANHHRHSPRSPPPPPPPPQISRYGLCLHLKVDSLDRGVCDKEFAALRACFLKAAQKKS